MTPEEVMDEEIEDMNQTMKTGIFMRLVEDVKAEFFNQRTEDANAARSARPSDRRDGTDDENAQLQGTGARCEESLQRAR